MPICDTIVYCFNATNPLNRNDLPILQELNEVLLHTDFFYIYTRADDVYRKSKIKNLSAGNFNEEKARRDKDVFTTRLNDALSHLDEERPHLPTRKSELLFIGNEDNFGIGELKARIQTPPGDLTTLALQKLNFFRGRSIECLDGILKILGDLSMTVRELVNRTKKKTTGTTKHDLIFAQRKSRDFWRSAQGTLRETLGRYKELETPHVLAVLHVEALEREALRDTKSVEEIERLAENTLKSLTTEIGRINKTGIR